MLPENKEKMVYNVSDLVDLLGISISSIYKGIENGSLPHVKVGSRILVPKKLLDEFLTKKSTQIKTEV